MGAYDNAVAYLDAEVHPRCDYDIYSDMRDIVDEMEAENAKLRDLVRDMFMTFCTFRETAMTDREELEHSARFWKRLDELGIEVDK